MKLLLLSSVPFPPLCCDARMNDTCVNCVPIKTHCIDSYCFIQLPLELARSRVTNQNTFVLSFLVIHVVSYLHWCSSLPQVGSCLVGKDPW